MLSIVLSELLKAIVSQVNVVVLILERVVVRACPQIAFFVEVKLILVVGKGPHADVKLPTLEQHRPFNVLLDHPVRVELPRREELLDFLQTVKDLDPPSLVHVSRLDEPVILLAVLYRCLLLQTGPFVLLQIHVSCNELMELIGVELRGNYE